MNIKVEHQEMRRRSELVDLVTKEVAVFCMAWKQALDTLLKKDITLEICPKNYGYDIRYRYQDDRVRWFFQLELFYPNPEFEQKITYMKISRFITLPTRQGNGRKVFNALLACCEHLKALDMIRLRAVRNAVVFWKKQNFHEQSEEVEWLNGDHLDYDQDCLKRPKQLTKFQYIYNIKRCDCASCKSYYKEAPIISNHMNPNSNTYRNFGY